MAKVIDDEGGKSSGEVHINPTAHEQQTQEGSLRSLLRKSSDFAKDGQRIYRKVDSYPKNRRYVHIQLPEIFTALTNLYAKAFECQWSHFKRTGDAIAPTGTSAADSQKLMAQMYVSHWMLDLYYSVRSCVKKLSSVALNEAFPEEIAANSNEYDAYLVELNAAIRPTHIVGCHEDVMFIPRFPDNSNFTLDSPFGIENFALNFPKFKAIMNAIKDKRASWKTAYITTDLVGRPSWLFDWFKPGFACAWFPMIGNFSSVDVAIAYILGVACTPKLAHSDDDNWQVIPAGLTERNIDISLFRRVNRREVFADYEVEHFAIQEGKFNAYLEDSDLEGSSTIGSKRRRGSQKGKDSTIPGYTAPLTDDDDMIEEVTDRYICLKTYLYYSRVIMLDDERERMNAFYSILLDPMQHCTN